MSKLIPVDITNKDILFNIKKAVAANDTTMENMCIEMGLTKSYLSSAISKKKTLISLEILIWLSNRLNISVDSLLMKKEDQLNN